MPRRPSFLHLPHRTQQLWKPRVSPKTLGHATSLLHENEIVSLRPAQVVVLCAVLAETLQLHRASISTFFEAVTDARHTYVRTRTHVEFSERGLRLDDNETFLHLSTDHALYLRGISVRVLLLESSMLQDKN